MSDRLHKRPVDGDPLTALKAGGSQGYMPVLLSATPLAALRPQNSRFCFECAVTNAMKDCDEQSVQATHVL